MPVRLANVTFDCDDPEEVARFWSSALDCPLGPNPTPFFVTLPPTDGGPGYFFIKVPEPKTVKNRVHVDLRADDRDGVRTEADRLVALGATVLRDPKEEHGAYWATLQDPEGNEFCIGAP